MLMLSLSPAAIMMSESGNISASFWRSAGGVGAEVLTITHGSVIGIPSHAW